MEEAREEGGQGERIAADDCYHNLADCRCVFHGNLRDFNDRKKTKMNTNDKKCKYDEEEGEGDGGRRRGDSEGLARGGRDNKDYTQQATSEYGARSESMQMRSNCQLLI